MRGVEWAWARRLGLRPSAGASGSAKGRRWARGVGLVDGAGVGDTDGVGRTLGGAIGLRKTTRSSIFCAAAWVPASVAPAARSMAIFLMRDMRHAGFYLSILQ